MKHRLKYRFDNLMSRGTGALIVSLALVTLIMITIVSFVVWITDSAGGASYPELLWFGVQRSLDPSIACSDTGCVVFVLSMFVIALGGVFIFSILVGLLTNGISCRISDLQKGHSRIVESGHTVILGWSNQVFTYLSELVEANSNHKHCCVAVMSLMDKAEMDEIIRQRIPDAKTTRIVTRNGSPLDLDDLNLLSLRTAHAIIVNESDDASVVKALLAIVRTPRSCDCPYHIVAALREPKNLEVAKIASRDQAVFVQQSVVIPRIIAQTCRQAGLSAVYTELFNFEENEIYLRSFPELAGKTYGEALSLFETSAVIGLSGKGGVRLNPPMQTVLCEEDEIIAVTEDDDTLLLDGLDSPVFDEGSVSVRAHAPASPEALLMLGWNENAPRILEELDQYVAPGSNISIASALPAAREQIPGMQSRLNNLTITFFERTITSRQTLNELFQTEFPHVILLSNHTQPDMQKADAETLVTLLHLREIAEKSGRQFTIVSEMLDVRNRKLAEAARVNDFIVSETILGLLMTQISQNKVLGKVFEDIFDADGSELYSKPVTDYVVTDRPVRFSAVVEAARRQGESAFGYKVAEEERKNLSGGGVHVNPKKSGFITFRQGDCVIVAAEN